MRIIGAFLFAVLATVGMFALPYWGKTATDVKDLTPQDEVALSRRFIDDLRADKLAEAAAIMDRTYRPKDPNVLARLRKLIPNVPPQSMIVLGWTHYSGDRFGSTSNLVELYDFGKAGAVQARFMLIRDPVGLKIGGVNLLYVTAQTLHGNDFVLPKTASDVRWAFLSVAVAADIFAFMTFALCLMAAVVRWRWRWLWLIFALIGGVRFNLDWVSLLSNFQPATVLLPPAGFYRFVPYGSWVLSISAPIGALIYWAMRMQWREDANLKDLRTA
jgi:hypothetical protein